MFIYKAEYVIAGEEKVRAHFVAAPDHPLARRQEVDVRELLQEPFMLTERGMSYRRLLEEHLAEQSGPCWKLATCTASAVWWSRGRGFPFCRTMQLPKRSGPEGWRICR